MTLMNFQSLKCSNMITSQELYVDFHAVNSEIYIVMSLKKMLLVNCVLTYALY